MERPGSDLITYLPNIWEKTNAETMLFQSYNR